MEQTQKDKIRAEKIIVKYGKNIALDSFTASIPEGISGLLGPNGAGKSTFIKSILGLIEPASGKIKVDGVRDDMTTIERRDIIGYMPEHQCLIDDMEGFEFVSYMSRLSGLPRSDAVERSHAALDFVGLGEERYREISSYSTGMKQRVKLAQCIAHDPEILLLDEPTTGMDPDGKKEMLTLIKRLGGIDKTLLISSHILHEIEQVSDYVVIINKGRKVKSGFMDDIMKTEEGRYKLKILGDRKDIHHFIESLKKNCEIIRTVDKQKEVAVVVSELDKTDKLFELVEESGIQLRYLRPDLLTLEDFFLESLSRGEKSGDRPY